MDHLPGIIYVEAMREAIVREFVYLTGIYAMKIAMVPLDQMTSVFRIPARKQEIKVGSWVRFRRGIYATDLAQVTDLNEANEMAWVKFVPRLDVQKWWNKLRGEDAMDIEEGGDGKKKKRAKAGPRPPARLFRPDEVRALAGDEAIEHVRDNTTGDLYERWDGNTFRDGFQVREVPFKSINAEGAVPTLEELQIFNMKPEEEEDMDPDAVERRKLDEAKQLAKMQTGRKTVFQKVRPSTKGFFMRVLHPHHFPGRQCDCD